MESWPCDLKIPNLTKAVTQPPGAAVLGKKCSYITVFINSVLVGLIRLKDLPLSQANNKPRGSERKKAAIAMALYRRP